MLKLTVVDSDGSHLNRGPQLHGSAKFDDPSVLQDSSSFNQDPLKDINKYYVVNWSVTKVLFAA